MKNKKLSWFLGLLIILTLVISVQYLSLRHESNSLNNKVKYDFLKNISSFISNANILDINKINEGEKEDNLLLWEMYTDISLAYTYVDLTYKEGFVLAKQTDIVDYKTTLNEIKVKSIRNKLNDEDLNKIKLLVEDLKVIYKYVDENDNLNIKKYEKVVSPNLKFINTYIRK